jgi:hypothetical protein
LALRKISYFLRVKRIMDTVSRYHTQVNEQQEKNLPPPPS